MARTAGVRMLTQSGVATYKFWNTPERLLTFFFLWSGPAGDTLPVLTGATPARLLSMILSMNRLTGWWIGRCLVVVCCLRAAELTVCAACVVSSSSGFGLERWSGLPGTVRGGG